MARSDYEFFDDKDIPTIEPGGAITAGWEVPGAVAEPSVRMLPTSFRAFTLPLVGTGTAIRVVGGAPYPQRVVLFRFSGPGFPAGLVFVTSSINELNSIGAVPAGVFQIALGQGNVLTLAPGQSLFAAASIAGTALSVSASPIVPLAVATRDQRSVMQTSFRTIRLNPTGVGPAVRVVVAASRPQRVLMQPLSLTINLRLSSSPEELNAFGTFPAGAWGSDDEPLVFVVAPGQPLFATIDIGSPVLPLLSVSASEIAPIPPVPVGAPLGMTKDRVRSGYFPEPAGHAGFYEHHARRLRPTKIQTFGFQAPNQPVRIAPASDRWLRVQVTAGPGGSLIAVSSSIDELTTVPVLGGVFLIGPNTQAFVLPPGQALFGAATAAGAGLSVQVETSEALFDCCDYV